MQKKMTSFYYIVIVGIFGILIWLLIQQGSLLQVNKYAGAENSGNSAFSFTEGLALAKSELLHNLQHPLGILILQISAIMIAARILGLLFSKIGQPSVIGEIVAGIILGPSVVGSLFPEFSAFLFPIESLGNLQFLSQIGLILFMFIIGMELDVKVLRNKAHAAVIISHASIIFPYFLGMLLAYFLYQNYAPDSISFLAFALFMGIAMSITAFPVLARIIQEKGLSKTNLGIMAITCAAADDVTAWCILAGVIAIVKAGNVSGAVLTFGLSIGYVGFMLYVVQPFLKRLGSIYVSRENLNKTVVAFVFLLLLLSSYLTEIIGIHALFGAFLAGVIMPHNLNFKRLIAEKIEDISLVLLLPLFFVLTGLRTQIGLLNEGGLWLICGLVILVAVIGKFGGSALAARLVGQSWRDSLSIGALMNTRGLMELVVLNIGYDLGILSPEIFAIMVLMAITTTFMTSPMLSLINYFFKPGTDSEEVKPSLEHKHKVLISFGAPKMGSTLLKLACHLNADAGREVKFVGLHISPESSLKPQDAALYEKESFAPIKSTAHDLGIKLVTKYKNSSDVERQIVRTTHKGRYNMLLVGGAKDLFSKSQTGGKIKSFLHESKCMVGVLIDNGFKTANSVLILVSSPEDEFLVQLARQLVSAPATQVQIMSMGAINNNLNYLMPGTEAYPVHERITIVNERQLEPPFLKRFDLVVLSLTHWEILDGDGSEWTQYSPSILIVKPAENGAPIEVVPQKQVAAGL